MAHTDRTIVLIDMDCFYCQVEEKLNPTLYGKPMAVVQYNAWRGGGIIAVNYAARDKGVTRHMRGDEARIKCPEIELCRVPCVRGKADLTKYREAGKSVAKVLQSFTDVLERASVDEAYLDITESVKRRLDEFKRQRICLEQVKNTHVVGCNASDFFSNIYGEYEDESNFRLAVGSVIVEEIRAAVNEQTGFQCSAGIAHNKILAKLACGLHKPNKQTILPQNGINELYKNLPLRKIRSLGGKFGTALSEDLEITNMAELAQFTESQLQKRYDEKTARFLYNIARGIDLEPVTTRLVSKSIGTCKKFPGKTALTTSEEVQHWLGEFAKEIIERLEQDYEENNRKAKQMVVTYSNQMNSKSVSGSKTLQLNTYDFNKMIKDAFETVKKQCVKTDGNFAICYLGLSVGKFQACKNTKAITDFFKTVKEKDTQHDCDNFSDSTDELNERTLDDPFNCKKPSVPSDDDKDSISEELFQETMKSQSGFFAQYLQEPPGETCPRDFNTSRHLDADSEEENAPIEEEMIPMEAENAQSCTECGKSVPLHEIISHMDHHLALKIAKEDKVENKPLAPKTSPSKKVIKQKAKRRKTDKKQNTLTAFLTNVDVNAPSTSEEMETCPQCDKQIEKAHLNNHLDYHFARKLHMELNPIKLNNDKNLQKKKDETLKRFFKTTEIL